MPSSDISRRLHPGLQEQVMVSVACNGAHSLKQRLALALMMRDRSDEDTPITQSLAEMRRSEANRHAGGPGAGTCRFDRARPPASDDPRSAWPRRESCECYQLVRARLATHHPKYT